MKNDTFFPVFFGEDLVRAVQFVDSLQAYGRVKAMEWNPVALPGGCLGVGWVVWLVVYPTVTPVAQPEPRVKPHTGPPPIEDRFSPPPRPHGSPEVNDSGSRYQYTAYSYAGQMVGGRPA